jgi:hypothetical protein
MSNFFNNHKATNRFDRNYSYKDNYKKNGNGYKGQNGNLKRSGSQKSNELSDKLSKMIDEIMPAVKTFLEGNAEPQKRLADLTETKIETEQKKAIALQRVATALESMAGITPEPDQIFDVTPFTHSKNATDPTGQEAAGKADISKVTKEQDETEESPKKLSKRLEDDTESVIEFSSQDSHAIISTITKLRESGMYFKQIAQHIESQGVPTLSGKGEWSAAAVSKLLKSKR